MISGVTPLHNDENDSSAMVPSVCILTNEYQESSIYNITANTSASPRTVSSILPIQNPPRIRLLLTSHTQMIGIPSDKLFEQEYNSNI